MTKKVDGCSESQEQVARSTVQDCPAAIARKRTIDFLGISDSVLSPIGQCTSVRPWADANLDVQLERLTAWLIFGAWLHVDRSGDQAEFTVRIIPVAISWGGQQGHGNGGDRPIGRRHGHN